MAGLASILQVNTYHYLRGGDSRCMFETARQLRKRGLEVHHFAMQHPQNQPCEDSAYFAPYVDYPELMAKSGVGSKLQVLKSSLHNSDARRSVGALLDTMRPDVAHVHSIMHHLTASVVLELRKRGIPIVWTLHDYKAVCPTTRLLRDGAPCEACSGGRFFNATRYRCKRDSLAASALTTVELHLHRLWSVYEEADLLIAPSQFLRDKVVEMGLRPRRIEVLPNFVESSTYEPQCDDEGYVLYVGRLSHEKGLPTLIEAAGQVPSVELRIAGTGELEGELRERCTREGWRNVRFEGFVGGSDLVDLYRGARALLIPSEWYENCPMVVLEAYAFGKPVIGSRLGGLIDLVEDGVTGALIEPGVVSAWSTALRSVAHEPEVWRSMGLRARERAEGRFDAKSHIDTLLGYMGSVTH